MASEFNIQNYDMDLYTLTPRFYFKYKIERYSSFIWTERNSAAGDFQIVMPPTPLWMNVLVPGCLVGMRGRRDIMIVENQSFENGLMTITGFGLLKFLNQRLAWFKNPDYDADDSGEDSKDTELYANYDRDDLKPGQFIADVIDRLCIRPRPFDTPYDDIALDWAHDKIPHLSLGYVTNKGIRKPLSFPNGQPIYDALTELATREHVGIQLYLERANLSTGDYVLRFRTHYGKDRTSSQTDRETVRFSPKLESLLDPKELRSNSEYKNVCYVNYKGNVTVHYAPHVRSAPVGFNRRVTYVDISDKEIKAAKRPAARTRAANAEFRKHRHTHQVDGQVISNLSDYQYGFDYQLGDIVEVEGHSGMIIKARVTEYVRSQDQYGPKVYPTLEIMAEHETAYHSEPTFEPDVLDPVYPETPLSFARSDLVTEALEEEDDLSFNPYTDPIFEGDEDVDVPDPQEQVGDLLDPGDPETLPVIGQGLTALTPWQVSDSEWLYNVPDYPDDPAPGFYVHQGNVYVVGAVYADPWSGAQGSDTLLSGIPPEYAPDTPVTGRVLIDHISSTVEFAYDSGRKMGPWLDVTINPNGTVTLDDGNPYYPAPGTGADGVLPMAGDGNSLQLLLSALTWPLSSQYDAYDRDHSLDDWVATDANLQAEFGSDPLGEDPWQNLDGTYSAHDERLHLNGQIQKVSSEDVTAPLIGIPSEFQPQGSNTFPTMEGYIFTINSPSFGEKLGLYQLGAQNPQSAENKGCGHWASVFYQRRSNGYLPRGTTPTLSFGRTTYVDDGVEYIGCSGSPVGDLPDSADWRGNVYRADVRFKLEDLISMRIPDETEEEDIDFSLISGDNQLSFVCGIAPGIESYYKVSYTYDSDTNLVSVTLMLMQCDGINRSVLARHEISPFIQEDGTVQADFSLTVSPRIQDTVYIPPGDYVPVHPEYNFWSFYSTGHSIQGNDYDQTPFVGISVPSGNSKGDMGFHVPLSSKAESLSIGGVGDFPYYAPGDVIDFTNFGWSLYAEEDTVDE